MNVQNLSSFKRDARHDPSCMSSDDLAEEFVDTLKTELSVINNIPPSTSPCEETPLPSDHYIGLDVDQLIVKLGALQEVPFCAEILNVVTDVPEFAEVGAMAEYLEQVLPNVAQAMMNWFPKQVKEHAAVLRNPSFSFTKNLPFYASSGKNFIEVGEFDVF
jgi:hypothetical protein